MSALHGLRMTRGAWPTHPAGRIPLLDVQPDLDPRREADTRGRLTVSVYRFGRGFMPTPPEPEAQSFGYLVLKGLLLYEPAVCGRSAAELLGAGEVIPVRAPYSGTIATETSWTVLDQVLLADLGSIGTSHAEVVASLGVRCAERAERIAVERSIGSHVRVDVRVLAYLWHLADRFGTVAPDGVKLDLPLTHSVLARLVGARRPTVTTALQRLLQMGYVARDGRAFRLLGDATSISDLDQRSPARDFAYPDGGTAVYRVDGDGDGDGNGNGFAIDGDGYRVETAVDGAALN